MMVAPPVVRQMPKFCGKKRNFFTGTLSLGRISYTYNYGKLSRLLIRRNLPASYISAVLNFYLSNFVRVSCCGYFSEYSLATNGVKQGAF